MSSFLFAGNGEDDDLHPRYHKYRTTQIDGSDSCFNSILRICTLGFCGSGDGHEQVVYDGKKVSRSAARSLLKQDMQNSPELRVRIQERRAKELTSSWLCCFNVDVVPYSNSETFVQQQSRGHPYAEHTCCPVLSSADKECGCIPSSSAIPDGLCLCCMCVECFNWRDRSDLVVVKDYLPPDLESWGKGASIKMREELCNARKTGTVMTRGEAWRLLYDLNKSEYEKNKRNSSHTTTPIMSQPSPPLYSKDDDRVRQAQEELAERRRKEDYERRLAEDRRRVENERQHQEKLRREAQEAYYRQQRGH